MPVVREAIGLRDTPRFTTLPMFADRPEIMAVTSAWTAKCSTACGRRSW